jgi:hypothetical protein
MRYVPQSDPPDWAYLSQGDDHRRLLAPAVRLQGGSPASRTLRSSQAASCRDSHSHLKLATAATIGFECRRSRRSEKQDVIRLRSWAARPTYNTAPSSPRKRYTPGSGGSARTICRRPGLTTPKLARVRAITTTHSTLTTGRTSFGCPPKLRIRLVHPDGGADEPRRPAEGSTRRGRSGEVCLGVSMPRAAVGFRVGAAYSPAIVNSGRCDGHHHHHEPDGELLRQEVRGV